MTPYRTHSSNTVHLIKTAPQKLSSASKIQFKSRYLLLAKAPLKNNRSTFVEGLKNRLGTNPLCVQSFTQLFPSQNKNKQNPWQGEGGQHSTMVSALASGPSYIVFESLRSQYFPEEKLLMLLRLLSGAGQRRVNSGLKMLVKHILDLLVAS